MKNRVNTLLLFLSPGIIACGGDRAQGAGADAEIENSDVAACDLLSQADAEAILGAPVGEPTAREISGMAGERATSCIFAGDGGTLMVRAWIPYRGSESTGTALAARVQSERAAQAADESDAELQQLTASATITSYDEMDVPAALEDTRAGLGGVTLHLVKRSAHAYIAINADTPEKARMTADRVLARLP